jgi:hypothetical protein
MPGRLKLQRCAAPVRTQRKRLMDLDSRRVTGVQAAACSLSLTIMVPAIPSPPLRLGKSHVPHAPSRASLAAINQGLVTLSAVDSWSGALRHGDLLIGLGGRGTHKTCLSGRKISRSLHRSNRTHSRANTSAAVQYLRWLTRHG